MITKDFLRKQLIDGHTLDDLFYFEDDPRSTFYKASEEDYATCNDDDIVYIPYTDNYISYDFDIFEPVEEDMIDDILENCWTKEDFISMCHSDDTLAFGLFKSCNGYEPDLKDISFAFDNLPNWHGCPEIKFVWHGEWATPEIVYKGNVMYSSDIEDVLWDRFLEDGGTDDYDNPEVEKEFDDYVCENAPGLIEDYIWSSFYNW